MMKHQLQANGKLRSSDNWQRGIPITQYMKSLWRHFMDVWRQHRGLPGQDTLEDSLCAVLFNTMGMLHEVIKARPEEAVPDGTEIMSVEPLTCGDCTRDDVLEGCLFI